MSDKEGGCSCKLSFLGDYREARRPFWYGEIATQEAAMLCRRHNGQSGRVRATDVWRIFESNEGVIVTQASRPIVV